MCNSADIQRRVSVSRAQRLLAGGASIEHVLGQVWCDGFVEGGRDYEAEAEAAFDLRVDEINRDIEAENDAILSGCREVSR